MKLKKETLVHNLFALASLCTFAIANAQDGNCPMTGQSNLTHDQETTKGTLTTSTGDPRPLSYGSVSFTLNAARTQLIFSATIYNIDVTGTQTPDVNDNLAAAHIHVGAPPGSNGPVRWGFFGLPFNDNNPQNTTLTPFATGVGGTFSGTWDLPEGNAGTNLTSNLPGILSGMAYINFHTRQFGGGEIRGQIYLYNQGACGTGSLWYRDWDGDGFGDPARSVTSESQPMGYVGNNQDCNDYRVFYQDMDNDGWGSSVKVPCGTITRTGDCDDNNNKVHSMQTFYRDADGDSWGDPNMPTMVCSSVPPAGYVANRMDCNDNDKMIRYCPPMTTGTSLGRNGLEEQAAALTLSVTPNPFVHQTRIQYRVPVDAQVNLKVFDVLGREVNTLFSGQRSAGTYTQDYNTAKLPSGVYYLRMVATADGKNMAVQSQKLVKAE
jgi:hypothetical protein